MALEILKKAVNRFFKYTNSFQRYDQKTIFMQCPGGTEKRGIGNRKAWHQNQKAWHRIQKAWHLEVPPFWVPKCHAFRIRCHAFRFRCHAFRFPMPRISVLPGHCIKIVFWSYLWNELVHLKNLFTAFLRILRAICKQKLV